MGDLNTEGWRKLYNILSSFLSIVSHIIFTAAVRSIGVLSRNAPRFFLGFFFLLLFFFFRCLAFCRKALGETHLLFPIVCVCVFVLCLLALVVVFGRNYFLFYYIVPFLLLSLSQLWFPWYHVIIKSNSPYAHHNFGPIVKPEQKFKWFLNPWVRGMSTSNIYATPGGCCL